jgi:hypothetical protein
MRLHHPTVYSTTRSTSADTLPVTRMIEQGQCTHAILEISPRSRRVYTLDVVIPRVEELAATFSTLHPARSKLKTSSRYTRRTLVYPFKTGPSCARRLPAMMPPHARFLSCGSVWVARVKGGCNLVITLLVYIAE